MAVLNPIFNGSRYLTKENSEILIDKTNAYKYFKKLYIISPLNNKHIYQNKFINNEEYELLVKNLIVHEVDFSLMTNNLLSKSISVYKKEDLDKINKFNLDLEDFVLVIPILTITYSNITNFSSININNDLKSLYIFLTIVDYFGKNKNHFITEYNIDKKIDNIKGSNYYNLPFNINKNFSIVFNNRFTTDKQMLKYANYDFTIKKSKYLNLASIQFKNNDLFTLTPKAEITKEQFNKLFDYLMINTLKLSKNNINLINKCLANPKYCHLILNNYEILTKIKTFLLKNKNYYKSLIGYSWIRFYQDELILANKITKDNNIIFDIKTANLLPIYQIPTEHIYYNPYLPMLVNKKSLNFENNILGLSPYSIIENDYGICTLDEFKTRLNLFCTNDSKNNLFDNINFKEYNMVICGSIMPACLPKKHPLLNVFENNNLSRLFKEYYSEADIDIAINVKNHFTFCKNVSKIFEQILLNFCNIFPYGEPTLIKKIPIKKIFLFVKENYIEELCKKNNVVLNDIRHNQDKLFELLKDTIIQEHDFNVLKQNNLSEEDKTFIKQNMPEFAYTYNELLMNNIEINTLISIHKIIYDNSDILSDISYHSNKNKNFAIRSEIKYKVSSPMLDHNLEIFQNRSENPFNIINNFHLNCVRCYYDGDNVYLTPSCVSSYMTNINMDYKYFVSNKSPWEIINKYRMRGFGTLLNNKEIEQFSKWSRDNIFWNKLYTKITGFLHIDSIIFKPRLYNSEYFINSKSMIDENNPEYKYIISEDFKVRNIYPPKSLDNINPANGNILPLKTYYLDIDYAIDNMLLDIN
jgi:hypothetical protein